MKRNIENKYKIKTKHYIILFFSKFVSEDGIFDEYHYGLETYTENHKFMGDCDIREYELDSLHEQLLDFGFTQQYINKLFKEKINGPKGKIKLIVPNQKIIEEDIERIKKINKENGKKNFLPA